MQRCRPTGPEFASSWQGGFFFFIFKKNKISKIYVRFGKFQKYTPVALWGATGLKCNFFSSNLQRSPWREKKEGGLSPPQWATGPCRPPQGRQASGSARGADRPSCGRQGGPVAPPPTGDRVRPPLYKASPLIPSSFDLKKSKKIQKKERGEKKGNGEALPNSALVIYR